MSIFYISDVYAGFTKNNKSYLFKIIETSEAYNAVLVECVENPVFVSQDRQLYAIIGNTNDTGVCANSKRNTTQNIIAENQHLTINGKLTFVLDYDARVPVGFRYWVDVSRLKDYKLYNGKHSIWLLLEQKLLENGI